MYYKDEIRINETDLTIVTGPILSGKTTFLINKLKYAIQNNIPAIFNSLDLSKQQVIERITCDDKFFKLKQIYIGNRKYVEDIEKLVRERNIKLILIDNITDLQTREDSCLGRGEIISIIIKHLKELAEELNLIIIATVPAVTDNETASIKNQILSYFCKAEIAERCVDEVYLLNKNAKVEAIDENLEMLDYMKSNEEE